MKKKYNGIFITGTDTGVGKTVATATLGLLLRQHGLDVGVMKPVQCGGDDAAFLKKILALKDDLDEINPCYSPKPLSPHLAFPMTRRKIDITKILKMYAVLAQRHDIVLVEGAGGIHVPLMKDYFVSDLIRELGLDAVVVARLGLGTINHSLLTVNYARDHGIEVRGVLFSCLTNRRGGVPEKTNPEAIAQLGEVPVLGTIPYLKKMTHDNIQKFGKGISLSKLLRETTSISSRDWAAWDKKYVWHPFTQMKDWLEDEPVVITRAKGCYLYDADGTRYIDGVSSLWVNVHGHRHLRIDRAVKSQINRLSHSTLLGLANGPSVELAKKLIEIAPSGLEKVFYSDNGSTAAEVAVKMAYQYWQNIGRPEKTVIAHLANSYHGDTLGSVSVGGIDLFHKVYRNLTFSTLQIDFPDGYRAPAGKRYPDYFFECLDKAEEVVKQRHGQIAALILEPMVQGAAGMIVWPEGVLKRFEEICRRHDVLFIVDEVATGFGRTGKMFACEHENVQPDLMCLAKGITGGYLPLAATLTTKRVFDGFSFPYKDQKTFFHGHTYTGNPLACAAALANLDVFQREKTLSRLQPKIKCLDKRLKLFYNLAHVGDVRQCGFMAGIELVRDRTNREGYPWEEKIGVKVCRESRRYGVMLRPLGNVIVLMPPLAISNAQLNELLDVTYNSIKKITEEIVSKESTQLQDYDCAKS